MPQIYTWFWGVVVALGVAGVLGAESGRITPSDTGWLAITLKKQREKPPVWFSHRLHEEQRITCTQCHHQYQGRRNVWRQGQPVQKCESCHGLYWQDNRLDIKNAYHRQCKGCHVKLRQQKRRAGPIHCQECHRRG